VRTTFSMLQNSTTSGAQEHVVTRFPTALRNSNHMV